MRSVTKRPSWTIATTWPASALDQSIQVDGLKLHADGENVVAEALGGPVAKVPRHEGQALTVLTARENGTLGLFVDGEKETVPLGTWEHTGQLVTEGAFGGLEVLPRSLSRSELTAFARNNLPAGGHLPAPWQPKDGRQVHREELLPRFGVSGAPPEVFLDAALPPPAALEDRWTQVNDQYASLGRPANFDLPSRPNGEIAVACRFSTGEERSRLLFEVAGAQLVQEEGEWTASLRGPGEAARLEAESPRRAALVYDGSELTLRVGDEVATAAVSEWQPSGHARLDGGVGLRYGLVSAAWSAPADVSSLFDLP